MSMVAQFFMVMGGALAGYVIVGLAAALGKLIVGAILRFRFDEFIFFMIRIGKKAKGISVGLCDPQPYISCSMLDARDTKMRNLFYGAFSIAMALFCTENVCIWLYGNGTRVLPVNPLTISMSAVMVVYTVVLIVMLGVTQKKKSGNDAAGIIRQEYERCFTAIKAGTEPGALAIRQAGYTGRITDLHMFKKYLLMQYYHFLDAGDYDGVRRVMDEFEKYVPDRWSQAELPVLCEFVFYHVIIAPNEGKAKYYGKTFLEKLDGSEEVNAKRVFAYWLLFIEGDRGAALQIAMEAIKIVSDYRLIGCQAMERRLVEALIKKIESMP